MFAAKATANNSALFADGVSAVDAREVPVPSALTAWSKVMLKP
jgi:hypothetical protein